MKITEAHILFPGLYTNASAFNCVSKDTLTSGICTQSPTHSEYLIHRNLFPQSNRSSAWDINVINKSMLHVDNNIVKYTVYSLEEVLFMLEYDEQKEITLEYLITLAKGRATFLLDNKLFLQLLGKLQKFGKQFKYSSTILEKGYRNMTTPNEYVYSVAIHDINTVFTNVYSKSSSGLCLAFEILSPKYIQMGKMPCAKGAYLLFTDTYEGIFYRDGQDCLLNMGIDFTGIYERFRAVIAQYDSDTSHHIKMFGKIERPALGDMPMFGMSPTAKTGLGNTLANLKSKAKGKGTPMTFGRIETVPMPTLTMDEIQQARDDVMSKVQAPTWCENPEVVLDNGVDYEGYTRDIVSSTPISASTCVQIDGSDGRGLTWSSVPLHRSSSRSVSSSPVMYYEAAVSPKRPQKPCKITKIVEDIVRIEPMAVPQVDVSALFEKQAEEFHKDQNMTYADVEQAIEAQIARDANDYFTATMSEQLIDPALLRGSLKAGQAFSVAAEKAEKYAVAYGKNVGKSAIMSGKANYKKQKEDASSAKTIANDRF